MKVQKHLTIEQFNNVTSIAILLLSVVLLTIGQHINFLPIVNAFTMSNADWIIDFGNLNSTSGHPTGTHYKVSNTVGEFGGVGLYSGTNYKVRAGFQYIYSIIPFRFTISNLAIDFGSLTPTNPITRTNTLTVSNGSADGYTVTAFENHALLSPPSGQQIPDTTCDSGTCNESAAAAWTSTLTYGFGYRCDNVSGTDCPSVFATPTYYRQFSNTTLGETPQAVMSGTNVGRNKQSQITYKVNISGTQAAGTYSNVITFIATPTF